MTWETKGETPFPRPVSWALFCRNRLSPTLYVPQPPIMASFSPSGQPWLQEHLPWAFSWDFTAGALHGPGWGKLCIEVHCSFGTTLCSFSKSLIFGFWPKHCSFFYSNEDKWQ